MAAQKETKALKPSLEVITIVGKFSDGKVRQIIIDYETQDMILSVIIATEGSIRALENTIEGIDLIEN